MAKIKLTPEETRYYRKLFSEDRNYYTVVDTVRQLPMFKGRFRESAEILAFIEFISNLFHIVWRGDVFDRNHLRLMDILLGIQYAIEFEGDQEATEVIERIVSRFRAVYERGKEQIRQRVFAACKDIISRYQHHIPHKDQINRDGGFFLRVSRPYALRFCTQIVAGELPEWKVSDRKGISLDPLSYEATRYRSDQRLQALMDLQLELANRQD